jgi:O2-independent ubiquinone biosynthesis protein UbiU
MELETMELLCPAGSMPSVRSALDYGADAVYIGLKDETNARQFSGLNFSPEQIRQAAQLIHQAGKKLHIAINTYAQASNWPLWKNAADVAVNAGADVLIVADISILQYISKTYPHIELHLSVQASATNTAAIRYYQQAFKIKRVVLPRVLSLAQVRHICLNTDIEVEVFAFGSLCIMAEGRCYLSSYLTGESPNTVGACSPAKFVEWRDTNNGLETRLNDILIDRYQPNEKASYPTLCKGRFKLEQETYHALEEPTSLNTIDILPQLFEIGVAAVKIEGRQRSPVYVRQVTETWRQAIDAYQQNPTTFKPSKSWLQTLSSLSEGNQTTLGAYHRKWQ